MVQVTTMIKRTGVRVKEAFTMAVKRLLEANF